MHTQTRPVCIAACPVLEQNRLFDEVDKVYQQAILHFKDRSWYDRWRVWYLRRRITPQLCAAVAKGRPRFFVAARLPEYVQNIVSSSPASKCDLPAEINLFANRRFPTTSLRHNLLNYIASLSPRIRLNGKGSAGSTTFSVRRRNGICHPPFAPESPGQHLGYLPRDQRICGRLD